MHLCTRIFALLRSQASHPFRGRLSQFRRYRSVSSLNDFMSKNLPAISECHVQLSVDLGCNSAPRNPFNAHSCLGLDVSTFNDPTILRCDIFGEALPFADREVSCVTAFDFIEHIPRVVVEAGKTRFPFIEVMNEIYRVLAPGGLFLSCTPAFPFKEAFQDPTHVNIITEDTFPFYFSSGRHSDSPGHGYLYGFRGNFVILDQAWHEFRLLTLLKRPILEPGPPPSQC